jgi:hypothetical protein
VRCLANREEAILADIKEHMKIIGKDGAHVGTVDRVEGDRIKLTRKDSPPGHEGHHHYIDRKLVGAVEGDVVKLSVNASSVPEMEKSGEKV